MITQPRTTALSARALHFSFADVPVLHGVDVDLPWGSVTAVAGPNGAGKSTLVEILAGVRQPTSGSVERHADVALVLQRPAAPDTLPLTVRDVVTMGTWHPRRHTHRQAHSPRPGRAQRRQNVDEALEQVQLAALSDRPFTTLSGGQRQRALLAQGIARQARIFILDEPAAGLDADSRARTRAILTAQAAQGAAVACVTHDDDAIAAADLVIRLENGRLAT